MTRWLAAVVAFAMVALALDAFWLEPSGLRLSEYSVVLHGNSARPLDGLRIAVIADLHAGSWYIGDDKIRRVVALTNAAKPDLILLAGDYVVNKRRRFGGTPIPIERIVAQLKLLDAPLGTYAVVGNHDHWEDASRIVKALQSSGITPLENQHVRIHRGGQEFELVGIGDYSTGGANPKIALEGVPDSDAAICLTHSPDIFPSLPSTCALTIAGHTHGGQVDLPVLGRLIVPSRFGERYAADLVEEGSRTLFVSTGIGTSILPVRFGVPPEVSLLRIASH